MALPPVSRRRRSLVACAGIGLLLALTACGSSGGGAGAGGSDAASGDYPVTVSNCGHEYTFDAEPKRVVLQKSASVPYLADLGVLDRVIAKAGQYPSAYYDNATQTALDKIPSLSTKLDPSGHLQISKEVVLAKNPDLVMGLSDTVNPQTLSSIKVPLLEVPALCTDTTAKPGFDAVYKELSLYGKVFDHRAQAAAAISSLRAKVAQISNRVPDRNGATGAVLYPTVGGGTTYAYGNLSMADPQLTLAGFTNVFGGVNQRVFEVSPEQLLARNPDVIVLLYSEGSPSQVKKALTSLPGASRLKAVRNNHILVQLFNFTEPPSPLALTGLSNIEKSFADVK